MAKVDNPLLSFASTRWYDWQGEITEELLISRWHGIEVFYKILPEMLSEEDLELAQLATEYANDKASKVERWRDSLVITDKVVIVDHVAKLVFDYEGVHELGSWPADILTRELDQGLRNRLPALIKSINETQERFDKFKTECGEDFEEALWKLYIQNFPTKIHGSQ